MSEALSANFGVFKLISFHFFLLLFFYIILIILRILIGVFNSYLSKGN